MGTTFGLFHVIFDTSISMDNFFSTKYSSFSTVSGLVNTSAAIFAGIFGAFLLSLIVERAKKCVDFTFTLFFIHLAVCTFYQVLTLNHDILNCDSYPQSYHFSCSNSL